MERSALSRLARGVIFLLVLAPAGVSAARADRFDEARDLVRALASVGGVAGHEGPVRTALRKAAPTWVVFQDDNMGNLSVSVGSGKPSLLVVAHMDEPGYVVSGVTDQGY